MYTWYLSIPLNLAECKLILVFLCDFNELLKTKSSVTFIIHT